MPRSVKCLLLANVAAIGFTTPALAQTAANAAPSSSTDIVVTAERRETSLQSTPIAITALPEKTLRDLEINTTSDLQRVTPSLSVAQGTVDPTTLTVFMRGAGQNAGTWVGYESAVGLYVDDLYFNRLTGANLDLADLERIEVLRGPQGTLYGRNTLVGAIKYVTKKPTDHLYVNALAEYGSYDMVRVKATVSNPISDDWSVLATGNYFSQGGYFNALAFDDDNYGNREEYGARAALEYIGSGPFQVSVSGFYSHASNDGSVALAYDPTTSTPATNNPYDYVSPVDGIGGSEIYGGSATLGYDFGNTTVKLISGVISGTQRILADTSAGQYTAVEDGFPLGGDRLDSHSNQTQWSEELQVLGDALDDRLHYIGGLYYFRETGAQERQDVLNQTVVTLPQYVNMLTESYAAYGQLTYELSDALSLVAGLRWTHEKKGVSGRTPDGSTSTTYVDFDSSSNAKAWTPKFGINWQMSDDVYGYVSVSRGFQGGGYNYLAGYNAAAYQEPFYPQTVWTYEVGLKTQFLNKAGRFNVAVYRNDFDDIQANYIANGSVVTQNAGTARVEGVEAELFLTPFEGLDLYANGAYSHDKYMDVDPTSLVALYNAKHIPNVPTWQYSVGANGHVPAGSGELLAGVNYSWIDDKYLGGTNAALTLMPAYGLLNGYVGYRFMEDRLELRVSGANLTDKLYYVYGNDFGTLGLRGPGAPRTFKVSLNFKY